MPNEIYETHYEIEPITNLGAKSKNNKLVPQSIKGKNSLSSFKDKVKKWIPKIAPVVLLRHI